MKNPLANIGPRLDSALANLAEVDEWIYEASKAKKNRKRTKAQRKVNLYLADTISDIVAELIYTQEFVRVSTLSNAAHTANTADKCQHEAELALMRKLTIEECCDVVANMNGGGSLEPGVGRVVARDLAIARMRELLDDNRTQHEGDQ